MKSIFFSVLSILLLVACALAESYIVTYPADSDARVVAQAKDLITKSGGTITHSFNPKSFSATTDSTVVSKLREFGHGVTIKNDNLVTAPTYKRFTA